MGFGPTHTHIFNMSSRRATDRYGGSTYMNLHEEEMTEKHNVGFKFGEAKLISRVDNTLP